MQTPLILNVTTAFGSRRVMFHQPRERNIFAISCPVKRSKATRMLEAVKRFVRWRPDTSAPCLNRW